MMAAGRWPIYTSLHTDLPRRSAKMSWRIDWIEVGHLSRPGRPAPTWRVLAAPAHPQVAPDRSYAWRRCALASSRRKLPRARSGDGSVGPKGARDKRKRTRASKSHRCCAEGRGVVGLVCCVGRYGYLTRCPAEPLTCSMHRLRAPPRRCVCPCICTVDVHVPNHPSTTDPGRHLKSLSLRQLAARCAVGI